MLKYVTTPDQIATGLFADLAAGDELSIGAGPLSLGQLFRVAHSGLGGFCRPMSARLAPAPQRRAQIARSIDRLQDWLAQGRVVYGVNTGFGGTGIHNKTLDHEGLLRLQEVLINGLLCSGRQDELPRPFVRGGMLQRVVSNFGGASALRIEVMESILRLLNHDAVPVTPLKGSLTASGDLVPLAYLAAVLQGGDDPRVEVCVRGRRMTAAAALAAVGQQPVRLQPKEGLALVNGTSVAAAAGCGVAVQALNVYLLTVVQSALAICVVGGSMQPYHPFVSEVKPHVGQAYAARMIFNLLHSTADRLLPKEDIHGFSPSGEHRLAQLTYPFRCASQHLAPEFGTLLEAIQDLTVEINATSDNPLILCDGHRELAISGGNFLGSSVARAMDKLKLTLHSLMRLAHAQFKFLVRGIEHAVVKYESQSIYERYVATHLVPLTSHPADNMGYQGVEIYLDALLSEANQKVGPHSTTYLAAEKENQAIVSMGLAAARAAHDLAADAHYCLAAHLLAFCQAFDLLTLEPGVVRGHEARRENACVENPRSGELGLLKPLYDFVRITCQVPVMCTSTRLHAFVEPLVRKIANLELLESIHEPCILAALSQSAYAEHSQAGGQAAD